MKTPSGRPGLQHKWLTVELSMREERKEYVATVAPF
jgi:hypothetical protein